jgi:hypothetical protein
VFSRSPRCRSSVKNLTQMHQLSCTNFQEIRKLVSNGPDILPTLCDYAGIVVPATLFGKSLRPVAEGKHIDKWRPPSGKRSRY